MNDDSVPSSLPHATVGSSDSLNGRAGSHRLHERVAVFLAGLEGTPSGSRTALPHFQSPQGGVSDALEGMRLPASTADPVQTRRQVVVLLDNESEDVVGRAPSTDTVAAQPQRSRGKRIRSEGPHYAEAPAEFPAQHEVLFSRPEKERRAEPRSHPATSYQVTALPVLQYYTPAVLHTVGESHGGRGVMAHPVAGMNAGHAMVDVSALGQVASEEVEALTTGSAVQGVPAVPAVDQSGSSTEQTSEPTRMTALEKAKLDWDTHITAMEHILSINRAQGVPAHSVSLEALQLLSQMISNLYTLNTKLLDTQMHQLLDSHHQNVERINSLFQGLAGLKRPPEKQDR